MRPTPTHLVNTALLVLFSYATLAALTAAPASPKQSGTSPTQRIEPAPTDAMPRYDASRALVLPDDYREWILAGSSLGLSYSQAGGGHEMFHHTLIEPSAFRHFVRTGTFREGTMLALILHDTGEGVLPSRRGRFASDVHVVEMAVKDRARTPEGWAYYNFGGPDGLRATAEPMPKGSCYNCHAEHAARDNVFLQFYSLLGAAERAGATRRVALGSPNTPARTAPTPLQTADSAPARESQTTATTSNRAGTQASETAPASRTAVVALKGLDPVMLVEGREEMGKLEIVAEHDGYRYQFVSEPNRAAFAAAPATFALQNKMCLVVPGAPINPSIIAVHGKRIYAFATPECVSAFKAAPSDYVRRPK